MLQWSYGMTTTPLSPLLKGLRRLLLVLTSAMLAIGCTTSVLQFDSEEGEGLDAVADALSVRLEAESMTASGSVVRVRSQRGTSGGKEVAFYSNGSLTGTFQGAVSQLQLRARGSLCGGAPVATVLIDDRVVFAPLVAETSYWSYSAPLSIGPGAHKIEVRFANDRSTRDCDRNLYVDYLALEKTLAGDGVLEGEAMTLAGAQGQVRDDSAASGGKALFIWSNDTASGTLVGGGTQLTVTARAHLCDGAPRIRVKAGEVLVGEFAITDTEYAPYTAAVSLPSGSHALSVSFLNDHRGPTCDRNVVVDKIALSGDTTTQPVAQPVPAFAVTHDSNRGRILVESDVLKLEFGYKREAQTHHNQGGGNLYFYADKRYAPTQNLIAVWEGGSANTKAYASGAGGMGSTQIYAVPNLSQVSGADYTFALADNGSDGELRAAPSIETLADGSVQLTFDVAVTNRDWAPAYEWYTVKKTWVISPTGRVSLKQDWRISKDGYFSEPAVRNQVSTVFKQISRWGHTWSNSVAGAPGTNSRLNPANKWYHWTPNPTSVQECNAPDGEGGSQDAVHADFNRFHGGANFDFWIWPDNGGLGFEGLGQYRLGYTVFGQSFNSTINEICHHNRALVGDGADAYNLGVMGWWGGDGVPADRFKFVAAGTAWTDSYQMEARPSGEAFPVDFGQTTPTEPPPPAEDTLFTLVAVPDTQRETNYYPARFTNRLEWLAANKDRLDLRFVMQVGDLVDWDTPDHIQYVRASEGMKLLENAGLPYAIAVGNHDTGVVCPGGSACPGDTHALLRDTSTLNSFFPASRFKALKGAYEPGKLDNAFHTFSAGGVEWLVLNLELWARTPVVNWAKTVLANHPKHNVIVITHSHLSSSGTISGSNGGYGDNSPQYIFDNLLKVYPNVRLVLSGHTGTTGYRVDTGDNGNKIYQILQTYHDMNTNPLRLLEIDTAQGTIKTRVYSPYTNEQKNDGSAFTITGVNWVK